MRHSKSESTCSASKNVQSSGEFVEKVLNSLPTEEFVSFFFKAENIESGDGEFPREVNKTIGREKEHLCQEVWISIYFPFLASLLARSLNLATLPILPLLKVKEDF